MEHRGGEGQDYFSSDDMLNVLLSLRHMSMAACLPDTSCMANWDYIVEVILRFVNICIITALFCSRYNQFNWHDF